MNRIMKETNIPWIGQIPEDWQVRQVKQAFNICKEKANDKNPVVLSLARDSVKIRDISNNEGQLAESYENYNPVKVGDLLLNPMDLYSGANCNMSVVEGVISPAYSKLRAKVDLEPRFFDYYFKTQYWTMAMFAHGKGVSFDNRWTLNNDTLKGYYLPFPSKDEQVRIVKAIKSKEEKINALITNEEKQIEKLKAYKQALISEVVTKGLDPNVPMKDSGVKWIGYVPKGWNILYLKQISIIKTGSTPPTSISEYFDGEINWYTPSDFRSSKTISSERKLTNKAIVDLNINLFPKHTTLIVGIGGTAGKISIIENAGYSNQQITAILSKKDINKKYLYYCLTAASKYLKDNAMYTTLPLINNEYLKNFKVCVPELNEQNEISKFLEEKCLVIDSIIECHNFRIKSFKEYRQSIIYEYVTGKREV